MTAASSSTTKTKVIYRIKKTVFKGTTNIQIFKIIRGKRPKQSLRFPPIDHPKYNVILADPPWFYRNNASEGNCERHYPTLKDQQLYDFPINRFAHPKQCALLMWCTSPKLDVGIQLMERWGFTYKTIFFVWCKVNKQGGFIPGVGNYTRPSVELLLIGVRGNIMKWKRNKSIRQMLTARRREHSRKPEEARTRIDDFFVDGLSKVELFARERALGWDVWGNEVNKFSK